MRYLAYCFFFRPQIIDTKINTLRMYYNYCRLVDHASWGNMRYNSFHLYNYTFPGVLLMSLMDDVKRILRDTLALDTARVEKLTATSPLLGSIIELDSVGVVSVLTAIEEEYGIVVEDDEISADVFKTLGSLTEFIARKIG